MKFTKMHGLGNDYIYVNCFKETIPNPSKTALMASRYHFGIGADGLILICSSEVADCKMRMFNADGTEGRMCGNGIRCVGKYVYDHNIARKQEITVETLDGIKVLKVNKGKDGLAETLRVDMGLARPGSLETIHVVDRDIHVFPVDVGSPHAVYVVDDVESIPLERIGRFFENHERFPDRVNSEFVQIIDREHVRMRVWERGSGITMACGTGACAAAIALFEQGVTGRSLNVKMDGGTLHIDLDEATGHVFMTGPAEVVFTGEIDISTWN